MGYPEKIMKRMETAGISVGDIVRIDARGKSYSGILMPHHEFSSDDIVTIKLDSGYNIGIELDSNSGLFLLRKEEPTPRSKPTIPHSEDRPSISVLGTGGTIASYVDYRTGAVHPALSAEDLAHSVPELTSMCNIRAKVLYSIFSEDMDVARWQTLAREAASELNSGSAGVIIPHGTDTLGFTSCALSFMLKGLTGPVVLVGAQRSSDRPSSDASINVLSAARMAAYAELGEVVVLMHAETSDTHAAIHRGTRVRKMHASRRNAFLSINEDPIGTVIDGEISLTKPHKKRNKGPVEVMDRMEEKVTLVHSYPGISPQHFDYLADRYRGVVIAGTGLGHVPAPLLDSIERAVSSGVHVVMTSQCLYGRVNMNVYSRGRDLLKAGVMPGEDMLPEAAFVKLMWVLGQTREPERVKEMMGTDISGEIGKRRSI